VVETGWFADLDSSVSDGRAPWRPYLQADGVCLPLRIWFDTEPECAAWIREHVLGQTELGG
jgi:hypothetical protein